MTKENVLSLDGKSYKEEELTDEQKYYKNQLNDLQSKILRVKFELDQLTASQNYFRNFVDDEVHTKQDCRNFIYLITLMEERGLNYFIINQSITNDVERFYPRITIKNIVEWETSNCIVQWYWKENNLSIDNDFTEDVVYATNDYHPGYFGHKKIGEYLYKWITKN